jgi:hypothetical protein
MNVTVTQPTASSNLTTWPTGSSRPATISLSFAANQTVADLDVTRMGSGGKVSLYNRAGETHVIADVVGYYGPSGGTTGARYTPLLPARVLDTRTGNGAPVAKVGPGATLELQVTGRGGVPAADVAGVVVTITAADPTTASYLTAWPTGSSRPTRPNLYFTAGRIVSNSVFVRAGTGGKVSIYNNAGEVHVITEVVGYTK